jgi:glutamate-1-semialdehyde 2,1-aminomutase
MTAGIATLKILSKNGVYDTLEQRASLLEKGLCDAARKAGIKTRFYRAGTMFCSYFTDTDVVDYQTAKKADTMRFSRFFSAMLERGIYIAPSQFEAGFLSLAHSEKDIEQTVRAAYESFQEIQ